MELEKRLEAVENAVKMAGLATKEVLTIEEAAAFTGLSKGYLYQLTFYKRIPYYKPAGGKLYFDRAELQAWLLQNRVSTADEIAGQAQAYCMTNRKGGKK